MQYAVVYSQNSITSLISRVQPNTCVIVRIGAYFVFSHMNEQRKRCETMNGTGFLAKEGFGWLFPTSFGLIALGERGVFMLLPFLSMGCQVFLVKEAGLVNT